MNLIKIGYIFPTYEATWRTFRTGSRKPKVQQATHASTGGHQGRIQHMYETWFLLDSRVVGWLVGWSVRLWLSWMVSLLPCWAGAELYNQKVGMVSWISWRLYQMVSPQHWMGVLSQWANKDSWNSCFNIQLFLQQSWKWFRKVPGKLGSSTVGSCSTQIHWTHIYKKNEISMTDFKNQCFASRYPTIFLTFHPLATWNYHLSCVHPQDFPTNTT